MLASILRRLNLATRCDLHAMEQRLLQALVLDPAKLEQARKNLFEATAALDAAVKSNTPPLSK